MNSPSRAAVALLAGQVLNMLGISSYSMLLAQLAAQWRLSHTESGLIGSGFFLGYICTVSFWSTLSDRRGARVNARNVYLLGCACACAGMLLFGRFAQGFWLALAAHMLYGVGVSATYMPGLKMLSEYFSGPAQTRLVSFYTAFFGLGSALSLWLTQQFTAWFDWRAAFLLCSLGPLCAALLAAALLRRPAQPPDSRHAAIGWRDAFPLQAWARVLQLPEARQYVIGYTVHCLELFGSRAWIVAFLSFVLAHQAAVDAPSAGAIAAVFSLCSVGASILGNEAALRLGRRRWTRAAMLASSLLGVAMALSSDLWWPWVGILALLYSLAVMADSATLTAGLVQATHADERGAALGLYSLLGFGGGMLGPALFGLALDLSGGAQQPASWAAGFTALGVGCLVFGMGMRGQRRAIDRR